MLFFKQTAAVAAGAVIGAVTRLHSDDTLIYLGLPGHWSILVINVLGAGVFGWLLAVGPTWYHWETYWRYFLTTGVLGGFTTTSAFALQTLLLNRNAGFQSGFWYVLLSVVLSAIAFVLAQRYVARDRVRLQS